jgi:hypothetical protein
MLTFKSLTVHCMNHTASLAGLSEEPGCFENCHFYTFRVADAAHLRIVVSVVAQCALIFELNSHSPVVYSFFVNLFFLIVYSNIRGYAALSSLGDINFFKNKFFH